jgi:DNA-binding GntR family transcriptional regulator
MTDPVTTRHTRRRVRLSDEAAGLVRERILAGKLLAGEFVRAESVAEELGISATPAREGLLVLQSEGFLRVEPRRGFVVAPLDPADIADVFAAQALLAGELTARAAVAARPDDISTLSSIQDALEEAAASHDYEKVEHLNHQFHRTLYALAGSPKLNWLVGSTLGYAPRKFFAAIPGWPQASARDHRLIIDLLSGRDAEAARCAMSEHIQEAGRLLTDHLENARRPST